MRKRTKKTLTVSGKVLIRLVLSTILCAILYISMLAIATVIFSDVIGYRVDDVSEDVPDAERTQIYYYADGFTEADKPEATDTLLVTDLREVAADTLTTFQVITQVMMLILFAIFPYHILWEFGNRDDTNVRYKGQRPDPWRGFRIGAIASIPHFVLWVLLVLAKFGVMPANYTELYRWVNIPYMPLISWLTNDGNLQATALWQLLLILLTVAYIPVVCGIAYRLGHTQFSVREHLVFANKQENDDEI